MTYTVEAQNHQLVPFRKWITINDPNIVIHGPFKFDVRNNRKMRDCISKDNWEILKSRSSKYNNTTIVATSITTTNVEQTPLYTSEEVTLCVTEFNGDLHFNDQTLHYYYDI